ncbi:MAG: FAD-binding protein [Campylobacteraceae bacterium]|nr:FAD-binding protein [Campylobacteraceae bacterium]
MSNAKRKVAVIGAGIAGSSAALGLLEAGFDVTLYSDKDRKTLRDNVPATGTAIYFGKPSQEADAQIVENIYGEDSFTDGFSVRGYDADKKPILSFDVDFRYFRAQGVDPRIRADDRIGRFIDKGGKFKVEQIDFDRLDEIAKKSDLTLIGTGKGGLSELFGVDDSRTVYNEPQRYLLTVNVAGLPFDDKAFDYRSKVGWKHNLFTSNQKQGEIFTGAFLHKDVGHSWILLGFAKPESEWRQRFEQAVDAASALQIFKDIFSDYFPQDAKEIAKFTLIKSDPYSWLKGAVTPLVRNAVGFTKSGVPVAALGDTAIIFDPIAGQGAQNVSVQVAALVKAAKSHKGEFDAEWIKAQFDAHWLNHGHGATEATRLYLEDPKYAAHLEALFPAAAVNEHAGSAFFRFQSEPSLILNLQTREAIERYIEEESGERFGELIERFKPDEKFSGRD